MVIAILILSLPGCSFTRLLTLRLEKPTFTYTGFELVEASQSGAIVNFLFIAHNPNAAGIKNVTYRYALSVDGKRILTRTDIPLALDPKGDTEIKVPATISYADLAPVLGSVLRRMLLGRKALPITVDAVFSGKPAILVEAGKETPVTFEKRVSRIIEIPLAQERKSSGPS